MLVKSTCKDESVPFSEEVHFALPYSFGFNSVSITCVELLLEKSCTITSERKK